MLERDMGVCVCVHPPNALVSGWRLYQGVGITVAMDTGFAFDRVMCFASVSQLVL